MKKMTKKELKFLREIRIDRDMIWIQGEDWGRRREPLQLSKSQSTQVMRYDDWRYMGLKPDIPMWQEEGIV